MEAELRQQNRPRGRRCRAQPPWALMFTVPLWRLWDFHQELVMLGFLKWTMCKICFLCFRFCVSSAEFHGKNGETITLRTLRTLRTTNYTVWNSRTERLIVNSRGTISNIVGSDLAEFADWFHYLGVDCCWVMLDVPGFLFIYLCTFSDAIPSTNG